MTDGAGRQALFAQDIPATVRLQALALRSDAEAFLAGAGHPAGSEAARLDAVLQDAPDWLISDMSFRLFEDRCRSELDHVTRAAGSALGVDPVAFAASGLGARTFLRMKAGEIAGAGNLADLMIAEISGTEARIEAKPAKDRSYHRRNLRDAGKRAFDMHDALTLRHRQSVEPGTILPPIYGREDRIASASGLTLRVPTEKEALLLAREWADGWSTLSPQNALSGKVAPLGARQHTVLGLLATGRIVGIFDGKTLVGSLMANRVSQTQVELGWFVAAAHRGHGVATAAVETLLSDLHRRGITEVGAQVMAGNEASLRMAAKLGLSPLKDEIRVSGSLDWTSFTGSTEPFAKVFAAATSMPTAETPERRRRAPPRKPSALRDALAAAPLWKRDLAAMTAHFAAFRTAEPIDPPAGPEHFKRLRAAGFSLGSFEGAPCLGMEDFEGRTIRLFARQGRRLSDSALFRLVVEERGREPVRKDAAGVDEVVAMLEGPPAGPRMGMR